MASADDDFFPSSPPPTMATLTQTPSSDPEADELEEDDEMSADEYDPSVLRISGVLKPPHAKEFTTLQLHEMIHEAEIDMDPIWYAFDAFIKHAVNPRYAGKEVCDIPFIWNMANSSHLL
jgi:hypothetical protein